MKENSVIKGKKILVGVTGSIAAYKTCSLINNLLKIGADVRVVMTEAATNFVTATTFQALTNHPVATDLWQTNDPESVEHISLSHWPDIIVIAPATSNTISKIALGISDNMLTTIIAAALPETRILIAPAMNVNMWNNPVFQQNLNKLMGDKKYLLIEPEEGLLACRDVGKGKIADTDNIIRAIEKNIV